MAAITAPAQAAEQNIDDVTLSWGMNAETGAAAFNGSCNFLSAGKAGDTGSSRAWTAEDGFYSSKSGDVSVMVPTAAGAAKEQSWGDRCNTGEGVAVNAFSPAAPKSTDNYLVWENGSGTVDPEAGTATINWDGSFTAVSYGGLFYFSASDPVLTVSADGSATLKATASGFGADQADPTAWSALPVRTVTLANLKNVEVDADGFTVTPEYTDVQLPAKFNQQSGSAGLGSFPLDFVEYQELVGGASYWYSSGAVRIPEK